MARPTNAEIEARKAASETTSESTEIAPETAADGNALLAQVLNRMLDMQAENKGLSKDDLMDVMEANSEGVRRALKPENAQHPDVSAFNPHGERDHPRPRLARKCFMSPGIELTRDELTVTEIELLNSIEHNMEARNGQLRAELKRTASDGTSELHLIFPVNSIDERMNLPASLSLLLREIIGGTPVDPDSLAKRVAELERQLAATQKGETVAA